MIPVFYACDEKFAKYTLVSMSSLISNGSENEDYEINILHDGLSDRMRRLFLRYSGRNVKIYFHDVSPYFEEIKSKLPIRDYYSVSTYSRMFIADFFPQYDKALYIDSDTVVLDDVAKLYKTELGTALVGAANEQAMIQTKEYGDYVENVLGISRFQYFNAGILLINCDLFRRERVLDRFIELLHEYDFIVTQDEDYLNLICKDRISWVGQEWNTEVFGVLPVKEREIKIIHYIMVSKPWHYDDCRLQEYFWRYADETEIAGEIRQILKSYTREEKERDRISCERLLAMAIAETNREDNYLRRKKRDSN